MKLREYFAIRPIEHDANIYVPLIQKSASVVMGVKYDSVRIAIAWRERLMNRVTWHKQRNILSTLHCIS